MLCMGVGSCDDSSMNYCSLLGEIYRGFYGTCVSGWWVRVWGSLALCPAHALPLRPGPGSGFSFYRPLYTPTRWTPIDAPLEKRSNSLTFSTTVLMYVSTEQMF